MRAMIEYPGKTEDEIREINRELAHRVLGPVLGFLACIGTYTNPGIARLGSIEVVQDIPPRQDDEGETFAA